MLIFLAGTLLTCYKIALNKFNVANVDANSSESAVKLSSDGVDTMLSQTTAKLLSLLDPNVSCQ
jgi:hypothetical protein